MKKSIFFIIYLLLSLALLFPDTELSNQDESLFIKTDVSTSKDIPIVFDLNNSLNQYQEYGFSLTMVSNGATPTKPEKDTVTLAWKDWPSSDDPSSVIQMLTAEIFAYWHFSVAGGKLEIKATHLNENIGAVDIGFANEKIEVSSDVKTATATLASFSSGGGVYIDEELLTITTSSTNQNFIDTTDPVVCSLTLIYTSEES